MMTPTEQAALFPEPPKTEAPVRNPRRTVYGTHGNGICWHERGARCWNHDPDALSLYWGRCRSGKRWFWAVGIIGDTDRSEHGWDESQKGAIDHARTVVARLAGGSEAVAYTAHSWAAENLRKINAAKRRARPPSDSTDTGITEYLYAVAVTDWDDGRALGEHIIRFRITKKTPKRIFYVRSQDGDDVRIGHVDRARLEADGEIRSYGSGGYWAPDYHLYLTPPDINSPRTAPESSLAELKQAMADAHPDRGGDDAQFIAARERYLRARKKQTGR
jgi:hypothetical protein